LHLFDACRDAQRELEQQRPAIDQRYCDELGTARDRARKGSLRPTGLETRKVRPELLKDSLQHILSGHARRSLTTQATRRPQRAAHACGCEPSARTRKGPGIARQLANAARGRAWSLRRPGQRMVQRMAAAVRGVTLGIPLRGAWDSNPVPTDYQSVALPI